MLKLDVSIHARPANATRGAEIELGGCRVHPLARSASACAELFAMDFEQAAERLAALDSMIHFEPDGWFIWHSPIGAALPWQINGNLYDRQQRLWYVPLRGTCPEDVFKRLLAVLAAEPHDALMFELTQAGVYLDLADLIAFADARGDEA